jgi:hypothetical protein
MLMQRVSLDLVALVQILEQHQLEVQKFMEEYQTLVQLVGHGTAGA